MLLFAAWKDSDIRMNYSLASPFELAVVDDVVAKSERGEHSVCWPIKGIAEADVATVVLLYAIPRLTDINFQLHDIRVA